MDSFGGVAVYRLLFLFWWFCFCCCCGCCGFLSLLGNPLPLLLLLPGNLFGGAWPLKRADDTSGGMRWHDSSDDEDDREEEEEREEEERNDSGCRSDNIWRRIIITRQR
jgi:hypothetical protein